VQLRDRDYHSGNWGGLLRNPATVLASAVASLVNGEGQILVPGLRPPPIPDNVRAALRTIPVGGGLGDPDIDQDWGEPGLTPAERVIGANTLEVLSLAAGNPDPPVNAIPGSAHAHCQLRFVPGTDTPGLVTAVRDHLDARGFGMVTVEPGHVMNASRTDPDHPWVRFALDSMERTEGIAPALLPNLGGSLPNDAFTDGLGLPTIWIPHSYPACAQHAPDEHLLAPLARQSLRLMTALLWDLGESPELNGWRLRADRRAHQDHPGSLRCHTFPDRGSNRILLEKNGIEWPGIAGSFLLSSRRKPPRWWWRLPSLLRMLPASWTSTRRRSATG
jgi:acetylornithine deacetylase/succinyl-diaminopimelate desuccinylase-like protein